MDWIVSQADSTTSVPQGNDVAFIRQTIEVVDCSGTKYKKVDIMILSKEKQETQQEPQITRQTKFKKFSEREIKQKRRTHTNKRPKTHECTKKKNKTQRRTKELLK